MKIELSCEVCNEKTDSGSFMIYNDDLLFFCFECERLMQQTFINNRGVDK